MARPRRGGLQQRITADWSRGNISDAAATSLPPGALVRSTDFIGYKPGILYKRGGFTYESDALTGASGTPSNTRAVSFAEFQAVGASKLFAIGSNGVLYNIKLAREGIAGAVAEVANLGSAFLTLDSLKLHPTDKLIVTANDGTTAPKKITVGPTAAANLGGSPPAGKFSAIYKSRLVLAATSANPNRIFFSPVPDIESTWDTANSYIDADHQITALAATSNMLIVFSDGYMERIIGTTPPPGTDMERSTVAAVGCTDARSVAIQGSTVIFANQRGAWVTTGGPPTNLCAEGLFEQKWQETLVGYDSDTWTIAGGILRNHYIVSVMEGGTFKGAFACYLPSRAWFPLTNIESVMFSPTVGLQEELYFADRGTNRVGGLADIFSPTSANREDPDGTNVAPAATFRMIGDGPTLKHFGFGRLTFNMPAPVSDGATLAVTYDPGIEGVVSAVTPAESPYSRTVATGSDLVVRNRFTIGRVAQVVTVQVTQAGESDRTEIYALEVDVRSVGDQAESQGTP